MKNFIIALTIALSNMTFAQGIWTEGLLDCGGWLNARKENKAQILEAYMVGMVNGMALGRGVEIWRARGIRISEDQLFYWLDSYCQKNPLSRPIEGAFSLADERTNGEFKRKSR